MAGETPTDPTAFTFGRLRFLCDEIKNRTNDLRHYLGELERGGVCIWCGEGVDFKTMDFETAVRWAREHDRQCTSNPLRAQLAAAERLIQYADRTDFNDEDWARLFDAYLVDYGLLNPSGRVTEGTTPEGATATGGYLSAEAHAVLLAEKDLLLEKCERWESLASQINTDWIPANLRQSARIAELSLELQHSRERIEALEAELAQKTSSG
jgi:hypothetical protein